MRSLIRTTFSGEDSLMFKPASFALLTAAGLALAACGGGASSAPKPSASAPTTAAKPSGAAAGAAVPSAAVVGQRAPGPYSPDGVATVTGGQASIEGTDTLKWQPNTLVVKGGEQVTLQIANKGNTPHTFLSQSLNIAQMDTPIQKTTPVSFTAPTAPGAYQFWCNIPGHAEAGMVGEVI